MVNAAKLEQNKADEEYGLEPTEKSVNEQTFCM